MLTYVPLILALVLRGASEQTADLSYVVMAGYALLGRPHALRALAFSWLLTALNPGLVPEAALASAGRYLIIGASTLAMFLHRPAHPLRNERFIRYTAMVGAFFVAHSLLFSSAADVSILKALSWLVTALILFSVWMGFSPEQRRRMQTETFCFLTGVLLLSLPLVVTAEGYLRNGTGFQGLLNQPQAFGATIALLMAWATAKFLSERQPSWTVMGIGGACLLAIFLSEARVAGLAMVGGISAAILLSPLLSQRPLLDVLPGLRSWRTWSIAGLVVLAAIVFMPALISLFDHYVTKSGRADIGGIFDAYNDSRRILIEPMLYNIERQPLTGIGFGIASHPGLMVVTRDPVFGLPLGAAIEKGVMPLAILEETGVFGLMAVLIWIVWLVRICGYREAAPLAVGLTAILTNLAEASMFAPGGQGLLILFLFAWAHASGRAHALAKRRGHRRPMAPAPTMMGRPQFAQPGRHFREPIIDRRPGADSWNRRLPR